MTTTYVRALSLDKSGFAAKVLSGSSISDIRNTVAPGDADLAGASAYEITQLDTSEAAARGYATQASLGVILDLINPTKWTDTEINLNASGDKTLISGIPNKRICIRKLRIQNIGATNQMLILKTKATAKNGTGYVLLPNTIYVDEDLICDVGDSFVINLSDALQTNGVVTWQVF